MAIFGLGVVAGLLLTPARKLLWNRWCLLGGIVAFLIFLPNLVWLIQHGFPTLELLANIRTSQRIVSLNPLQFVLQQVVLLNPPTLPLWLAGLGCLFFNREAKACRVLGWPIWLSWARYSAPSSTCWSAGRNERHARHPHPRRERNLPWPTPSPGPGRRCRSAWA